MTYFLARTVVEQDTILNTTSGRFLEPDKETVLFGRPSSIEVFRETELGVLTSVHKQPLFGNLLALARIAAQPCTLDEQCFRDLDLPMVLLESQRLAVLRYDAGLHRFANVISVDLQAAGLPRYLHGSILEVHERSKNVALATREGHIAVFRGAQDLLHSFPAPLTHQFPISDLACEPPPQYHDPRIVKDICFVAGEPHGCVLLAVLVEIQHISERQLHWLQVKPDCLAHSNRVVLDNGSDVPSEYSQLLHVPWPGGVMLLSSLRLMYIAFDAGTGAATASVIAEFHGHIEPYFESMYSHPLKGFHVEVDLYVVACWQSSNYAGGVMLVCLDTCKLLIDVERSHSGGNEVLTATAQVLGGPSGRADGIFRNCRPLFLTSGAFLLRTIASTVELHVPCELTASEQGEMYGVSQRLGHPATIVDATMCDLTGLSQPQVYAVSPGGLRGADACGMRVMHAGLVVETLFKSPANYQGVTGLWSIPFAPADASSALIIISFASGSRAMTAGSTFSDVTDLIDLECNSQTLAAGSIGNLLAAQVTSEGVFLCSLRSLWPGQAMQSHPHKSMLHEGAKDLRPRKRSSPSDEDVYLDFTSSEESVNARLAHADGARSSADSAAEPSEAFSSLHLEAVPEGRDRGMLWVPPGGATTSCACIREGIVVVACPQLKSLTALTLIHSADVESPSSSGKRKRSAPSPHMVEAAQIGMPAEVSCIDAMDAPKGLGCPGGLVITVGTYERALELLLLDRHHSTTNGTCWHFQRLCRLQQAALSPVLHSVGTPPNLTDLPESVLLLEGATQHSQMQVLVGWRSGLVMQIGVRRAHPQETNVAIDEAAGRMSACLRLLPQVQSATQSSTAPDVAECAWEMKLACVRRFTALPTRLIPLPPGMQAHALTIGERVSLLKFSPCSGKIQLDMLALADISHAVPLLDVSDSGGKSGGPKRCRLLVADGDGSLRLLELEAGSTRRTREFSLAGMPKCIAVHQPSATMVVLVTAWNDTNASSHSHEDDSHPVSSCLKLVDAASGAVKSILKLPAGQVASCMTSLGTSFSASKQDVQARAYFAVGAMISVITDAQLFGPNPLIRSCVTVFAADSGGIHPVAKVSLPDRMTAVCHFRDRQILVAAGQRLACFECSEDPCTSRMETIAWTPTREEIRSLSVSQQGVIAAAGETQSVTLYTCTADDGFEVLCADPHSRNAVSCLVGPSRPEGLQSAVCLDTHGGVYSLQYEQSERGLERNMHMDMHFHCRGTGVRIMPGSLRCEGAALPAGTVGPWVICTEEGSVMQLSPVAAEDYAVLAAVEAAMARSTLTAPVSGGSHSAFRSAVEGSAGGSRALAQSLAGGSMRAVDADFLVQLDELPEAEVQHVLDSVIDHDVPWIQAASHGGLMSKGTFLARARSLPYVMDLLDRVLNTY